MLDVKEDNKGGLPRTYQNALQIINQNCEELNLIDIWRTLNADKHRNMAPEEARNSMQT